MLVMSLVATAAKLSKPDKLRWRMVVCARSQCSGQRRPSPGHRRTTCRQFSQRRSLVILVYPSPTVFAAFSVALLVSALLGPVAGRAIDRWGGRSVLIATNVIFAAGLIALSLADGAVGLFAAWIVLGIGMGSGLYEAAFSALVRLYGAAARSSITGITLIAGFASTVGWPLSTVLEAQFGWRGACLAWACIHLFLGVPLNALIAHTLRSPSRVHVKPVPEEKRDAAGPPVPRCLAILLAFIFASTWFISTAMAAHLPQLLQASGASLAAAVAAGALIGPAQVGARMLEYGLLRRFHPLVTARAATLMHPLGAAVLAVFGAPAAAAFALLHGAGNGIMTIANGTLPLVLFGSAGYGRRQGLLMLPARIVRDVCTVVVRSVSLPVGSRCSFGSRRL